MPYGLADRTSCVVEIDAETVGEPEFDLAKGVVRPWLLAELAVRQDLKAIAPEIGPALGPDLFRGDALGHVPGGIEHHVLDGAADDRGPGVGPADDHLHVQDRAAVLHGVEAEGRDIDEDVPLSEVGRQPAPALQVHLDFADLLLRRPVHLGHGRRAGDPVRCEPMALLEITDKLAFMSFESQFIACTPPDSPDKCFQFYSNQGSASRTRPGLSDAVRHRLESRGWARRHCLRRL
jgi:hypothetical protein